ncbi:hypothetical protein SESI111939_08960 [Serratia silvae]
MNYVTGVNRCSQRTCNLKYDEYNYLALCLLL